MRECSKYQPLLEFLRGSQQNDVILSFAEIESLINGSLPDSAKTQKAWWSNRKKGALQAEAWIEAGYRVENVDFEQQQVRFVIPPPKVPVQRSGKPGRWSADLIRELRLHLNLTQTEFAERLGVRQATVSEWETGAYEPSRSTSKHLELIAKMAGFTYQ
jgi:DNA-binding XRE family transcriptional regulator